MVLLLAIYVTEIPGVDSGKYPVWVDGYVYFLSGKPIPQLYRWKEGTSPELVLRALGGMHELSYSPSLHALAYITKRGGKTIPAVYYPEKKAFLYQKKIKRNAKDVSFSPDGKYVYFTLSGKNTDIYRWNLSTGAIEPVLQTPANERMMREVNGKKFYLSDVDGGKYQVFVMEEGKISQITRGEEVVDFAPSPDGKYLLVSRRMGTQSDIFLVNLDTGNEIRITETPYNEVNPSWMPEGSGFLFTREEEGKNYPVMVKSEKEVKLPEFLTCSQCGFDKNKWEYRFCINCGNPLDDEKEKARKELVGKREDFLALELSERVLFYVPAVVEIPPEIPEVEEMKKEEEIPETVPEEVEKPEEKPEAKPEVEEGVKKPEIREKPGEEIAEKLPPPPPPPPPKPKKPRKPLKLRDIDPSILFSIPKAEVLPSLVLDLTAGGAFALEEEGYSPLGVFSIGFGDIAELVFSTQTLLNTLMNRSIIIPTIGFKMLISTTLKQKGIINERFPEFAFAVKGTWWNTTTVGDIDYMRRFAHLYLTLEDTFGPLKLVGGLSISDWRIKTSVQKTEIARSPVLFFGGVELRVKEKAYLIGEVSQYADYKLAPDGIQSPSDLCYGWWFSMGARTVLAPWMVLNMGARYEHLLGEPSGIADAKLWFGVNIPVDIPSIYGYLTQ